MATNLADLTTHQLKSIIAIKEQIETLQHRLDAIAAHSDGTTFPSPVGAAMKRRMSRAGRAKIAAGQRARWAKVKSQAKFNSKPAGKKDRRSSPAVRAKIAAAARARWAKAKAAGKRGL